MTSILGTFDLESGQTTDVLTTEMLIEAPNWEPSGKTLLVNGEGKLWQVDIADGGLQEIETGLGRLNNDHGLSPDGTQLALSETRGRGQSVIHIMPRLGGTTRRVTDVPGAYWHGWSPDGGTLAFCGLRNDSFDIYTIPIDGGAETRLTGPGEGHNDGPDYSADGAWIWFNSDRTGHAQIWRVPANGGAAQQMTDDDQVNWFPHPSPDGKWVLYLAYPPGTNGHPANLDVGLRLMRPDGSDVREVARFIGGQGTINVPCWQADGKAFAYVRYSP